MPRLTGLLVLAASWTLVAPAHATLNVVATTADLAALAADVGGEQVSVRTLSSADEDPHYVDPRPSLVLALARADLLLLNGVELEVGWLPPLLVNARNADIQVGGPGHFDASRHVRLLETNAIADRAMGDIHPGGNPHFLFDPRAGARVAMVLSDQLAAIDPPRAALYRANAKRVSSELLAMAEQETRRFAGLSADQRRVVTYHRSLVYMLDWLGIERPINIEPKPGVSPSPGHVAKVLATMRSQRIGTILQERFYPTKTSETLARMTKSKVVILAGGTNIADGQRYVDRMRLMAQEVYAALSR